MNNWDESLVQEITQGRWIITPDSLCNHRAHNECRSNQVSGVSIDTRTLEPGQIFIAFIGEQVDGHDYLQRACDQGASMCLITNPDRVPADLQCPVLQVDDPLSAITELAKIYRTRLSAKVIAITGSNGKTTTCHLMHSICQQDGDAHRSIKSFNNQLGVPITVLNTPIDAQYLIAEVGTSSHGEIRDRIEVLKPDRSIIVSIGRAHLEELGGLDGVSKEKLHVFDRVDGSPIGAQGVYLDGIPQLNRAISDRKESDESSLIDLCAIDPDRIKVAHEAGSKESTEFMFDDVMFEIPMLGEHNTMNAGLCVQIARTLGLSDEQICAGLRSSTIPPMRFEYLKFGEGSKQIEIILDAYNANPDSMRASLSAFHDRVVDRVGITRIVILGEMLEMGAFAHQVHQELIEDLGQYGSIDRFVLVGQSFMGIENLDKRCECVPSFDLESIERIARGIDGGSIVFLKGSRGVGLERVVHTIELDGRKKSEGSRCTVTD